MRRIVDLHCDTLTKGEDFFHSLDNPSLAVSLSKIPAGAPSEITVTPHPG